MHKRIYIYIVQKQKAMGQDVFSVIIPTTNGTKREIFFDKLAMMTNDKLISITKTSKNIFFLKKTWKITFLTFPN